jgi:hypothetical protein
MGAPPNEHEFRASITEDVFYPEHAPRVESPTFRKTKHDGKAAGDVCAISGVAEGIEYHHVFCEAAFMNAVDWVTVKGVGTGEIVNLPERDPRTGRPRFNDDGSPRTYPAINSLIWIICTLARLRGFDWFAFDPTKPETFVDSPQNMLVLNELFHRGPGHGIHHASFPIFVFQAFPRVPGFVLMPDELAAITNKTSEA